MKTYTEIPSLLSKAFLGTLSEEEERALQQWRDESPENEQLYESEMNTEYIVQKSHEVARVNIVNGYMNVLLKRKRNVRVRRVRRIVSIVAGVVLPLLAVVLWYGTRERIEDVSEQVASVIRHGGVKAELVLADGTTRILGSEVTDSLLVQQGANIVVQNQGVSYCVDSSVVEERYNTLRVPRGGEYSITLSDGTIVYLNSESELRYPVNFVGRDRRVYLSGEAYFDVVQDEAHPFIVDMGNSSVRVLGTSFDVRAYADEDEVLTTLVQGSVKFSAGKEFVTLEPGKQAVLGKSGSIETREVDTYLYTAWKEGVFAFKRQRLEEIMKVVARWYDVNIFWENVSQKEVTFTGKMKRYDDFSKVVEVLEMTGNTEFVIKENNIFIREK
ncbi:MULTISPECIES: FecR family protein [Butyricimonas]|uniref:FecR family protein n=1 Tax=Butyricimonas TaxID=574697 RepID=UPI001314D384|nr:MULTISPECIES: FecR family protein [Odoribacteraceae]